MGWHPPYGAGPAQGGMGRGFGPSDPPVMEEREAGAAILRGIGCGAAFGQAVSDGLGEATGAVRWKMVDQDPPYGL